MFKLLVVLFTIKLYARYDILNFKYVITRFFNEQPDFLVKHLVAKGNP